jgi:hypothetical protein
MCIHTYTHTHTHTYIYIQVWEENEVWGMDLMFVFGLLQYILILQQCICLWLDKIGKRCGTGRNCSLLLQYSANLCFGEEVPPGWISFLTKLSSSVQAHRDLLSLTLVQLSKSCRRCVLHSKDQNQQIPYKVLVAYKNPCAPSTTLKPAL